MWGHLWTTPETELKELSSNYNVAEKKKLFKKSAQLRVSQQRKHISFFSLGKEVFVGTLSSSSSSCFCFWSNHCSKCVGDKERTFIVEEVVGKKLESVIPPFIFYFPLPYSTHTHTHARILFYSLLQIDRHNRHLLSHTQTHIHAHSLSYTYTQTQHSHTNIHTHTNTHCLSFLLHAFSQTDRDTTNTYTYYLTHTRFSLHLDSQLAWSYCWSTTKRREDGNVIFGWKMKRQSGTQLEDKENKNSKTLKRLN